MKPYFLTVCFIFIYTTFANMSERPEGVQIALFFIATILVASILSRAVRATELRVENVNMNTKAQEFIDSALKKSLG